MRACLHAAYNAKKKGNSYKATYWPTRKTGNLESKCTVVYMNEVCSVDGREGFEKHSPHTSYQRMCIGR